MNTRRDVVDGRSEYHEFCRSGMFLFPRRVILSTCHDSSQLGFSHFLLDLQTSCEAGSVNAVHCVGT